MPRAGLAVDMFFVMSGFVLAHSYQHRFDAGMTSWQFIKSRLIRLWPLYALGTSIAVTMLLFGGNDNTLSPKFASSLLFALVFLPTPIPLSVTSQPFPFDGPAWSLFFELGVNSAWVVLLRRSRLPTLIATCGVAATIIVVSGGTVDAFNSGMPRVAFSFFAGILSYAAWKRWPADWRFGAFGAPIVLVGAFMLFAAPVSGAFISLYQLGCMALFPVLIWAGAKVSVHGVAATVMKVLGISSYAIYILHEPVFSLLEKSGVFSAWPRLPAPFIAMCMLLFVIVLAPFVDITFDRPVRRWLTAKFLPVRRIQAPSHVQP